MDHKEQSYVRFDWAMKRLLRDKANFEVLEGFLTVLLGEEIKIQEILESEGNSEYPADKYNHVDIKALNHKGQIVIIEVQNVREFDFIQRVVYGASKAVTEQLSVGDRYEKVHKVYSISIVYFPIGQGNDYIYRGTTTFRGQQTGDELYVTERDMHGIVREKAGHMMPEYYILRVDKFDKVATTPLEEWMHFLKEGAIRVDTQAPGLKRAKEVMDYALMSPGEQKAYRDHYQAVRNIAREVAEGREEGRAEGLAVGRAEGRAE
ncbi:MAG: Rpn family recombination-promoting nuclease/putative transposase, partial [Bacteroidales bacterium]|nr:Rpn family recombination-promoting nuclease/putative transposase [Bacteroidales bacterium]